MLVWEKAVGGGKKWFKLSQSRKKGREGGRICAR